MADGIRTAISEELLNAVVRGGKFVDSNSGGQWMSPSEPLKEVAPKEVAGRQFDYPVGYNINIKPRYTEPVGFDQLRSLADNLDLLRLVIETRKDLVCALEFEIKYKDESKAKDGKCEELEAMFAIPDRDHVWAEWLRMLLEDLLVIDAPAIYPRMTKGGKLYALEPLDGATISRKIGYDGRTPIPPQTAYQQVLKGVPAANFTRDELIYRPRNIRTNKLYGFSPVEQIIMSVNIALRRQLSQLQYYTEGSTPDSIFSLPPEWDIEQVKLFQQHWNDLLVGNTAERRKARFIPGGVGVINTKELLLKDEYDEWLAKIITYAFSVPNQPFVKQMNRATAETAQEQAISEGLQPILMWVKNLMNYVIAKYYGYTDVAFAWVDNKAPNHLEQADIELKKAQEEDIRIKNGTLTVNEAREIRGLDEIEEPEPSTEVNPVIDSSQAVDDKADEVEEQNDKAEKLEKKKGDGVTHQTIDRDRKVVVDARERLQERLTSFLSTKGDDVADQVIALISKIGKADDGVDESELLSANIVNDVALDWVEIIQDVQNDLLIVAIDGMKVAAVQIKLEEVADITKLPFTRAETYAKERAAELVGKKWVNGELVTNPNPKWAITDSTRDMINADVNNAIKEGWSNDKLRKALQENLAFSPSRAEMIARTETAIADVEGNMQTYQEAEKMGLKVYLKWLTAKDDKVSKICQMNSDQVVELGKPFASGATKPPNHPRCRCDVAPTTVKPKKEVMQ